MAWQWIGMGLKTSGLALMLGGATLLPRLPAQAAEEIFLRYGPLERSIRTSSLEALSAEGTISEDLAFYFNLAGLSEIQIEALRQNLDRPLPIDGVLLSRFLYTNLGDDLLDQVGAILQTRSGDNGKLALRAALIQAAISSQGLSTLSMMQALPTEIQINVADALALANAVEQIVNATNNSVARLATLTAQQAAETTPLDYASLTDLSAPGSAPVRIQRFELTDTEREGQGSAPGEHRQLYVDVVRPTVWRGQAPVMVFSHGLSSSPEEKHRWASHLASHGIVVVLPQHPGSDAQQVVNFRAGLSQQVFELQEFIDRPLDITFVLNELERLNPTEFDGRLNLAQVGVGGHSLGGYTALAVAGAELNFPYLEQACDARSNPAQNSRFIHLNMSLLLQCQALDLPRQPYTFRDPRINSVLLINPVNSSIFGPEGLAAVTLPVMIIAGSHDPATPAVFEQFRTFPWYSAENGSLVLIEGQAHVDLSALDAGLSHLLTTVPGLALAEPEVIERYMNAIGLAFVGRYVARRPDYDLYLRSGYATYLSQSEAFRAFMVNTEAGTNQELTTPLGNQLDLLKLP